MTSTKCKQRGRVSETFTVQEADDLKDLWVEGLKEKLSPYATRTTAVCAFRLARLMNQMLDEEKELLIQKGVVDDLHEMVEFLNTLTNFLLDDYSEKEIREAIDLWDSSIGRIISFEYNAGIRLSTMAIEWSNYLKDLLSTISDEEVTDINDVYQQWHDLSSYLIKIT